jgi:hypothetical protein
VLSVNRTKFLSLLGSEFKAVGGTISKEVLSWKKRDKLSLLCN